MTVVHTLDHNGSCCTLCGATIQCVQTGAIPQPGDLVAEYKATPVSPSHFYRVGRNNKDLKCSGTPAEMFRQDAAPAGIIPPVPPKDDQQTRIVSISIS